jgi:hypothetical protein
MSTDRDLLPTYETAQDVLTSIEAGLKTAINHDAEGVDGVRLVIRKYGVGSPERALLVLWDAGDPIKPEAALCLLEAEHYNHGIDDDCRCLACGAGGGADWVDVFEVDRQARTA